MQFCHCFIFAIQLSGTQHIQLVSSFKKKLHKELCKMHVSSCITFMVKYNENKTYYYTVVISRVPFFLSIHRKSGIIQKKKKKIPYKTIKSGVIESISQVEGHYSNLKFIKGHTNHALDFIKPEGGWFSLSPDSILLLKYKVQSKHKLRC